MNGKLGRRSATSMVAIGNAVLAVTLAMSAVPPASAETTVGIAAAGDIVCNPDGRFFDGSFAHRCQFRKTANAIMAEVNAGTVDAVAPLGDTQYCCGTTYQFTNGYDLSWGQFRSVTEPAIGNHEWLTSGADGYFRYFDPSTPQISPRRYYYSYDLGSWHIIVLDSNCGRLPGPTHNPDNGCVRGSPQMEWLENDLARSSHECTLAYWHHPVFSSAETGFSGKTLPFWRALYAEGAEIILGGHRHVYERFAPLTPTGARDNANGIVQFVVGSGGEDHGYLQANPAQHELARDNTSFGYLRLMLGDGSYSFRFVPVAGGSFSESGSGSCH